MDVKILFKQFLNYLLQAIFDYFSLVVQRQKPLSNHKGGKRKWKTSYPLNTLLSISVDQEGLDSKDERKGSKLYEKDVDPASSFRHDHIIHRENYIQILHTGQEQTSFCIKCF